MSVNADNLAATEDGTLKSAVMDYLSLIHI